jgi:hypothetical protein
VIDPTTLRDVEETITLEAYDDWRIAVGCPLCDFLAVGCCEEHAVLKLGQHAVLAHRVGNA